MKNEIRKLARIEEGPSPFVSLYLNTRWDSEQQRERTRLFIKNQLKRGKELLKGKEGLLAFEEDLARVEKFVEGLIRRSYDEAIDGMALFSSRGSDIFLVYPSFMPFDNEFYLDRLPVLRPLVRLASQYQDTLAVMVETDSARLFEISLEGLVSESTIENYVPGWHDQGGWAQLRYQRHIQEHRNKHHKEVAEQLTNLFDTGKWKRVVLIGQDRTLAHFRGFLPERVRQHITDAFPLDFSEERSTILRRIYERLFQREKEKVFQEVEELREKAYQGGRAVFGLNGVLEAINQGRVQTLYLSAAFHLPGGHCLRCGTLFLQDPSSTTFVCPLCKEEAKGVDLGEEMVRFVFRQDGEVKWAEGNPLLKEHEHVAASLRFR
ncbi:MAG: Vms1/Ankzf1 family peptidyl-tRNA hydrolase [Desulfobacterota bacterium]|nr:Vms1/Ankzf1 family peptidyl-tRNA hydrolase [Thermodesulfobacteriota bacterium]